MVILWWIIVGLIAGFITGKLMKGSGFGAIMDIVIGIVGALVGGFIMRALGFAGHVRQRRVLQLRLRERVRFLGAPDRMVDGEAFFVAEVARGVARVLRAERASASGGCRGRRSGR